MTPFCCKLELLIVTALLLQQVVSLSENTQSLQDPFNDRFMTASKRGDLTMQGELYYLILQTSNNIWWKSQTPTWERLVFSHIFFFWLLIIFFFLMMESTELLRCLQTSKLACEWSIAWEPCLCALPLSLCFLSAADELIFTEMRCSDGTAAGYSKSAKNHLTSRLDASG